MGLGKGYAGIMKGVGRKDEDKIFSHGTHI